MRVLESENIFLRLFPERWGVKGFLGDGTVTIPELGKL